MRVPSVFLLLSLLVLAGCVNRNVLEVVVERCPAVAVVGDFGVVTRFADDLSKTVEDIDYTATINDVRRQCDEGSSVKTDIEVDFVIETGAAHKDYSVTFQYFVAVMRDNAVIVSKDYFDITVPVGADNKVVMTDVIRQVIPDVEQLRRYDYEILIGFKMTPDEAAFNLLR